MSNGVVAVNEVRAGNEVRDVEVSDVEVNDVELQVVSDVDDDRYGEWQDVDRELRSIARRQSGLDAALMLALRAAERVRLWREVGCISMMEYLERVFGYSPRVAQERLRTARKLEALPELAQALAENELSFSAVRELTRVATPATEKRWRGAARGKCLREIEEMVSGRAEGDDPTSPKKPELETARVSYEHVKQATRALEREARKVLEAERGERLDDDEFLAALYGAVLGARSEAGVGDRAKFQIVRYHCEDCGRTKQLGAGVKFDLDEAEAERGECDADRISLDAPTKVTKDIPKAVRRFVDLRDGKRCRIPGCRSAANLELHHIIHREDGGGHEPENLLSLCDGHHSAHHEGKLWISGTASQLVVRRPDEVQSTPSATAQQAASAAVTPAVPSAAVPSAAVPSAAQRLARCVDDPEPRSPGALPIEQRRTSSVEQAPKSRSHARPASAYGKVELRTLACSAIRRLGWKPSIAAAAVDAVLAQLSSDIPLEDLIRAALPRCRD
jgi:hypothetical protein